MKTLEEVRKELDEAKQRLDDLTRTENESRPAEEDDGFVKALAEAEDRVAELTKQLNELLGA